MPKLQISSSQVLYFSFLDYLGYWISASWIIWDIGFQLSGLFGILDFVIPGSL
ncbi:hypothetical protein C1646_777913 [Rhizophagus diaphanus]|nr:hypothetical protein C1646_777913 [Rhizophagus diaphanus] [Rhizophagus sp. MUCL 43196]